MNRTIKYTLADLEEERRWDGGDGPNNPRAWHRNLMRHQARLEEIETHLKDRGIDISRKSSRNAWGEAEAKRRAEEKEERKISKLLNKLYPEVKPREKVVYEGKKYKRSVVVRYWVLIK